MTEFSPLLKQFLESWREHSSEKSDYLEVDIQKVSVSDFEELLDDLKQLQEHIEDIELIVNIRSTRYKYKIKYDLDSDHCTIEEKEDEGVEPSTVFEGDNQLAEQLDKLRDEDIINGERLEEALNTFCEKEEIRVGVSTKLQKDSVLEYYDINEDNKKFYFYSQNLKKQIEQSDWENTKSILFPHGLKKSVILVAKFEGVLTTKGLLITGISNLNDTKPQKFLSEQITLEDSFSRVGENSIIENFENIYIPPEAFELTYNDSDISDEKFNSLFITQKSVFSLFTFSDTCKKNGDYWKIRIRGKKLLEDSIRFEDNTLTTASSDEPIEISKEIAENLYSLYEWSYLSKSHESQNKLTVIRNVITLHCQSIYELINNLEEIFESVKSNHKYYIEQSIDKFVDFKQSFIDSTFEAQQKFSDLRNKLMDDLSSDLFRTLSYLIVLFVIMTSSIGNPSENKLIFTVSTLPLFLYLIVSYKRVEELNNQFDDIKEQEENHENFYKKFFNEEDFEKIKNGGISKFEDKFKRYIKLYKGMLILIGLIVAILVLSLYFSFNLPIESFDFLTPAQNTTGNTTTPTNLSS